MEKKLSPWCKRAKIEMVKKDIGVNALAQNIGLTRPYTSSILNGRVYSPVAVKKISDYLRISDEGSEL